MMSDRRNSTGMIRVRSAGNMGPVESKPERKVMVIYTGGTIGMIRNENGVLAPIPNMLTKKIKTYPQLHDEIYALKRFGRDTNRNEFLVLPCCKESCRILYVIHEYDPLLDSSNMSMDDWIRIACDIQRSYQIYDGFVILHGTDTLTYTASALSFMLENLGKTVVVTGSQIPIFETRSDGKDNFLSAVLFAGNYVIPEVTVFFGDKLFRGNRTVKISSDSFHAFDSPNSPPLATVGININVKYKNIFRSKSIEKFSVHTKLNQNVGLLRIFPSITTTTVKLFLQAPIEGVILQSYGSGNIPSNRKDLLEVLADATARDIIIVNCTQCTQGSVHEIYETGQILKKAGVVSGLDMTPDAALSKLSYVLSKDEWSIETKREIMSMNIRGELTSEQNRDVNKLNLINAVATAMNLNESEEIDELRDILCPAMLIAAVFQHNVKKLEQLRQSGVDLSTPNKEQRTALHIACSIGDTDCVNYLLKHGCSVHARDRLDRTPLHDAIEGDHHHVIKLLVKCGAHLTGSNRLIGEQLCVAAARASIVRLQSYQIAGVSLMQMDSCGRTALHVASLHGLIDVVEYLMSLGCDPSVQDLAGMTPIQLAEYQNCIDVVQLLTNFQFEQLSI